MKIYKKNNFLNFIKLYDQHFNINCNRKFLRENSNLSIFYLRENVKRVRTYKRIQFTVGERRFNLETAEVVLKR